jgi:hydrogenase maturation protein HypF
MGEAHRVGEAYRLEVDPRDMVLDPRPALAAIIEDMDRGKDYSTISARFHLGLAHSMLDWAAHASRAHGIRTLVCSGGVFANRTLIDLFSRFAPSYGLDIRFNRLIPSSDGGLSAGQLQVVSALG